MKLLDSFAGIPWCYGCAARNFPQCECAYEGGEKRKGVSNSGVLFGIFTSTAFLPLILYPGIKQSSKDLKKELGSVYHHFFLLCPLLGESKA